MGLRESKLGVAQSLGIILLIASLVHIPLPQPDFHNVRHHDAPGEVCTYHDHLLRWHPSAGHNADTSVLHWHWVLPLLDGSGDDQDSEDGQHHRPGSGPSLHANVGDGLEPDWSNAQWLASEEVSATLVTVASPLTVPFTGVNAYLTFEARLPRTRLNRSIELPHAHSALNLILQRWNC